MAGEWHYRKGDRKFGPIDAVQLKALATSGAIVGDDLVMRDGHGQWVKASAVKGLFAGPVPAAAAPVPPQLPNRTIGDGDTDRSDSFFSRGPVSTGATVAEADFPAESPRHNPFEDGGGFPSRPRPAGTHRDFPWLKAVSSILTIIAVLAIIGAGCALVTLVFAATQQNTVGIAASLGLLVASIAIAIVYFALSEGINLALYVASLLEAIRDK